MFFTLDAMVHDRPRGSDDSNCTAAAVPRYRLFGSVIPGLIAVACLTPLILTPNIRVEINPTDIAHEQGNAYIAPINIGANYAFVPTDSDGAFLRSQLILYQDSRPLGPAHSRHDDIRHLGGGAYSHWKEQLYFSTPDGSDPRTNGHAYSVTSSTELPRGLQALLLATATIWFAVLGRHLHRRHGKMIIDNVAQLSRRLERNNIAQLSRGLKRIIMDNIARLSRASKRIIIDTVECFDAAQILCALKRTLSGPMPLCLIGTACLVPLLLTPELRITVAANEIQPEIGKAYVATLPSAMYHVFQAPSDDNANPLQSQLRIYENRHPVGPPHSLHDAIRENGGGSYSHWRGHLIFSASDDSDPRSNNRTYIAAAPTQLARPLQALLVVISMFCFVASRRELRKRYATILDKIAAKWSGTGSGFVSFAGRMPLAIGVCTVAFAIAYFARVQYKTNDDVGMRLIAEGLLGDGSESQFLVFQNIAVGIGLRELYGLAPLGAWYDIELAVGAFVGAILCQIAVFRLCRSRRDLAFCAIAGVLFFTPIFQALQFTASAMILAGGAMLMFTSIWYRPPIRRSYLWASAAISVAAFLFGSLIRFHAAFLVLISVLPIVVVMGFNMLRRDLLFPAAAVAVAVVIALLAQAFDTMYYRQSRGWESFWEMKNQRARATEYLHLDTARPEEFHAALSAAQWTTNDYVLLSGWLFQNRELFSAERTKRFSDVAPRQDLSNRVAATYRMFTRPESEIWLFAALCFAPVLLRRSVHATLACVVTMASTAATALTVGLVYKPTFLHIVWPLYALVAFVNAAMIFSRVKDDAQYDGWQFFEDKAIAGIALTGLLYLMSWHISDLFSNSATADELRRQVSNDLAKWPARETDTIVVWDHNFPYEIWARPFHPIPAVPFRFLHTSSYSASPLAEPIYAAWGTSDVAWSICNLSDVYMVDSRLGLANRHAQALTTYMREHYRQTVKISPIFEGEALTLYSCRAHSMDAQDALNYRF
jgi:hypothetical protein